MPARWNGPRWGMPRWSPAGGQYVHMDVAVTGSSGLIGRALCIALEDRGDRVRRLVRRAPDTGDEITWDPIHGVLDPADLGGIDAVVHLAGAGIADRRWTRARMDLILESRTRGTSLIADAVAAARSSGDGPGVLVSGSAIGFYGDRGDERLDESSPRGGGFLADVCAAWEAATRAAEVADVRVAHARTGVVLSANGGLLARQLPIFRLGLGGPLGPGSQVMGWISIRDEVAALCWLIDHELDGPVNLVAPEPVTSAVFSRALGSVLRRPARLRVPAFAPMALFGTELVRELMLASALVRPGVLVDSGFVFAHPTVETCLRAVLGRD